MVEKHLKNSNKRARLFGKNTNLNVNNGERIPVQWLIDSLQEMLNRDFNGIDKHDFVRVVINKRYLQNPIN